MAHSINLSLFLSISHSLLSFFRSLNLSISHFLSRFSRIYSLIFSSSVPRSPSIFFFIFFLFFLLFEFSSISSYYRSICFHSLGLLGTSLIFYFFLSLSFPLTSFVLYNATNTHIYIIYIIYMYIYIYFFFYIVISYIHKQSFSPIYLCPSPFIRGFPFLCLFFLFYLVCCCRSCCFCSVHFLFTFLCIYIYI